MFCKKCGKEIKAGASFCEHCGTSVNQTGQYTPGQYTAGQAETIPSLSGEYRPAGSAGAQNKAGGRFGSQMDQKRLALAGIVIAAALLLVFGLGSRLLSGKGDDRKTGGKQSGPAGMWSLEMSGLEDFMSVISVMTIYADSEFYDDFDEFYSELGDFKSGYYGAIMTEEAFLSAMTEEEPEMAEYIDLIDWNDLRVPAIFIAFEEDGTWKTYMDTTGGGMMEAYADWMEDWSKELLDAYLKDHPDEKASKEDMEEAMKEVRLAFKEMGDYLDAGAFEWSGVYEYDEETEELELTVKRAAGWRTSGEAVLTCEVSSGKLRLKIQEDADDIMVFWDDLGLFDTSLKQVK